MQTELKSWSCPGHVLVVVTGFFGSAGIFGITAGIFGITGIVGIMGLAVVFYPDDFRKKKNQTRTAEPAIAAIIKIISHYLLIYNCFLFL